MPPETICMNIQEDKHRGENLRGGNSRTFRWNFQRCDWKRVFHLDSRRQGWIKITQTGGEYKYAWRTTWKFWYTKGIRKIFWIKIGWILICILCGWTWSFWTPCCWTCTIQFWWRLFCRRRWPLEHCDLTPKNLTRMGSNLERSRRILVMSSRKYPLKIEYWSWTWIGAKVRGTTSTTCWDHRGMRAIALDCRIGRDWWRTFRKCLCGYSKERHNRLAQMNLRVPTRKNCTDRGFNKQGACINHDVTIAGHWEWNSFTYDLIACWTRRAIQYIIVLQSKPRCENGNAGWFVMFVGWWMIQAHQYSNPKTHWTTGKNTWIHRIKLEQSWYVWSNQY